HVDDVLVLLRRVLRVFDGAVGTELEPFRMLFDPGMVGRALDGEIQRDLHAVPLGRGNEAAKILQRSEIRMDGGMTALLGPDRIGTAGVVRTAGKRVVRSLAEGPADGMDRHEVDDV